MRVETECVKNPEEVASVTEEFPDEDVTDFENLFV
jgi:hypothetical protein